MSEFIGSRISLISKSDIKYIGTLHEINSDSHTVALESVTSYGTEGRKGDPSAEIPGSDQVYEYIVFRGSDVKELTIVSPPTAASENKPPQVPNDPAILGSARPPPQNQPPPPQHFNGPTPNQPYGYPPNHFQSQARFQPPGGAHGFPGSPGAVPGYGGTGFHPPPPPGYGMGYPPPPHRENFGTPPGPVPPQNHMAPGPAGGQMSQRPPPPPQSSSPQVAAGSRQPTSIPGEPHGPTPSSLAHQKPIEMSGTPVPISAAGAPPPLDTKPTFASAASNAPKPAAKAANRVAVPLAPQKTPARQPAAPQDATQAATAAVAAAMAKLGNVDAAKGQATPQTQTDNLTRQVNQMRLQDGQARGRGAARGGRGAMRGGRREAGAKVEVPKEDYDFESANAKFNKQDVVKEAVGSGSPAPDTSLDASTTNGHDDAEDVVIPPKPSVERGYDKKSSFFDNISSDLKDRMDQGSDGVDGRAMRREERTRNVETFGQGSVDGGHRGYRGRGRGGYSRGGRGYRGAVDTRPGFRGRSRGGPETTAA